MEISNRNGKPRGLGLLCFMAEVRPALVFFLDKNNILDLIKDHRHSILKFVFNRETNRLVVSVDPDIKHRRMARDFFMTTRSNIIFGAEITFSKTNDEFEFKFEGESCFFERPPDRHFHEVAQYIEEALRSVGIEPVTEFREGSFLVKGDLRGVIWK